MLFLRHFINASNYYFARTHMDANLLLTYFYAVGIASLSYYSRKYPTHYIWTQPRTRTRKTIPTSKKFSIELSSPSETRVATSDPTKRNKALHVSAMILTSAASSN